MLIESSADSKFLNSRLTSLQPVSSGKMIAMLFITWVFSLFNSAFFCTASISPTAKPIWNDKNLKYDKSLQTWLQDLCKYNLRSSNIRIREQVQWKLQIDWKYIFYLVTKKIKSVSKFDPYPWNEYNEHLFANLAGWGWGGELPAIHNFINGLEVGGTRLKKGHRCALTELKNNIWVHWLTKRFMKERDITIMKVKTMNRARSGIGIFFSTK